MCLNFPNFFWYEATATFWKLNLYILCMLCSNQDPNCLKFWKIKIVYKHTNEDDLKICFTLKVLELLFDYELFIMDNVNK